MISKDKAKAEALQWQKYLNSSGRNSPCFCGSGKKLKKCHVTVEYAAFVKRPEVTAKINEYQKILGG